MSEWHELSEIHTEETEFPVATTVNGADIVIFKNFESYYGVQRYCPHQDADFERCATIMGNGKMLRCTLHGFVFKLDTGKGVNAGQHCLDTYEIKRDGSQLQARKK
jgi:nitrite reductase/ring-hydroxylating ferredoxin subunit